MSDPKSIITQIASQHLAANARTYSWRVEDGSPKYNMLGNEVDPQPIAGEIVHCTEDWFIQKSGRSLFIAHAADLFATPLTVGDKVEIKHAGFNGTETEKEDAGVTNGFRFNTVRMSRAELKCPTEDDYLKDMTRQLSEMRLPDGRRGLRVLNDLKYANFRGAAPSGGNPYLEFEVEGAKFQGTVRMELVLGADVYLFTFSKDNAPVKVVDDVYFDDIVPLLEEVCDSSQNRLAKVTFVSKKKKAVKPA